MSYQLFRCTPQPRGDNRKNIIISVPREHAFGKPSKRLRRAMTVITDLQGEGGNRVADYYAHQIL